MHSFFRSTILLLALGLSTSAWAQEDERKSREERRALKMSEVDNQSNMSEAYRQAAHEKRLESITRAKEMLKGGQLSGEAKAKVQFRLAEMYFEEGRFYYSTRCKTTKSSTTIVSTGFQKVVMSTS